MSKSTTYYLDSTPTHSYMKYLYKYPQTAFPYAELVDGNRSRDRRAPELELIDTGVFKDDRYFDIFVEYAKGSPEDILIRITATNRGACSRRIAPAAHALVPQHMVLGQKWSHKAQAPPGCHPARSTVP